MMGSGALLCLMMIDNNQIDSLPARIFASSLESRHNQSNDKFNVIEFEPLPRFPLEPYLVFSPWNQEKDRTKLQNL